MGRNYTDFSGKNNPRYKIGLTEKGNPEKGIYNSWLNMKQRCLNPNHPKYHRYGGRGIKIHEPWKDILVFYNWAKKSGWKQGKTIDRIDNDGDYCPENCQWISPEQNSRKKTTTKITIQQATEIRKRLSMGECEYDLAKEYGVVHGTIWFIANNFTHIKDGECTKRIKDRRKK